MLAARRCPQQSLQSLLHLPLVSLKAIYKHAFNHCAATRSYAVPPSLSGSAAGAGTASLNLQAYRASGAQQFAQLVAEYGISSSLRLCDTPHGYGLCLPTTAAGADAAGTEGALQAACPPQQQPKGAIQPPSIQQQRPLQVQAPPGLQHHPHLEVMHSNSGASNSSATGPHGRLLVSVPLRLVLSPSIGGCCPEAAGHPALASVLAADLNLSWELLIGAMLLWAVRCREEGALFRQVGDCIKSQQHASLLLYRLNRSESL